jgi:hypothetical protein
MGSERAQMSITALLSRHNSDRDIEDNRLWAELVGRVKAIAADPRYAEIMVDVFNTDDIEGWKS